MIEFCLCVLYISIFILLMAVIYLISNLIFTFKLLFFTMTRLEKIIFRLESTSQKAELVAYRLQQPISLIQKISHKINGLILKMQHIFKIGGNYENN